ncbi:MAG: hypothetical protein IJU41_00865 [Clostridia bacterium]|nr:hypothetical protein [Clostridia bacterium]
MNYCTGGITADINGWGDIRVRDNATISYLENNTYDLTKNRGRISVTVTDGAAAGRIVAGDFNDDGVLSLADVLTAIGLMLSYESGNASTHFYGVSEITLIHVVYLLKQISI